MLVVHVHAERGEHYDRRGVVAHQRSHRHVLRVGEEAEQRAQGRRVGQRRPPLRGATPAGPSAASPRGPGRAGRRASQLHAQPPPAPPVPPVEPSRASNVFMRRASQLGVGRERHDASRRAARAGRRAPRCCSRWPAPAASRRRRRRAAAAERIPLRGRIIACLPWFRVPAWTGRPAPAASNRRVVSVIDASVRGSAASGERHLAAPVEHDRERHVRQVEPRAPGGRVRRGRAGAEAAARGRSARDVACLLVDRDRDHAAATARDRGLERVRGAAARGGRAGTSWPRSSAPPPRLAACQESASAVDGFHHARP